ncbi:MAG: filamentous hemagglutinin N-terminal domain-containing protein, partial [Leptolyngbya sp. SIO4C1]|nr:filamentous hemagglutinin N-terminal domain-containing protein [Leptolyngbya sp. SIO4C1]
MKYLLSHCSIALSSVALIGSALAVPAKAQVVPDDTLGAERSVVTPLGEQRDRIDGGALRGSMLFHSFDRFGILEGHGVYFANPDAVNTIFSRVIGNDPSNLLGTLGVLGDADLVFLNPNGILFGPNAELDLRGSFTATTASAVELPGGEIFSALQPEIPSLLEVNVEAPIGLVFEEVSQATLINDANLFVDEGRSIALLSNTVINSGGLTAPNGNVQILGKNIKLIDQASVNVSDETDGGDVFIGENFQTENAWFDRADILIGPQVLIKANSDRRGNGGSVVIWSSGTTRFYGNINASGGSISGNGGFVEVSGQQTL